MIYIKNFCDKYKIEPNMYWIGKDNRYYIVNEDYVLLKEIYHKTKNEIGIYKYEISLVPISKHNINFDDITPLDPSIIIK